MNWLMYYRSVGWNKVSPSWVTFLICGWRKVFNFYHTEGFLDWIWYVIILYYKFSHVNFKLDIQRWNGFWVKLKLWLVDIWSLTFITWNEKNVISFCITPRQDNNGRLQRWYSRETSVNYSETNSFGSIIKSQHHHQCLIASSKVINK